MTPPLCAWCGVKPLQRSAERFCSTTCRARGLNNLQRATPDQLAAGRAKGRATQRRLYAARVEAFLRSELARVSEVVAMPDLLPVALVIYRRAYDLGWHAAYTRQRRAEKRQRAA